MTYISNTSMLLHDLRLLLQVDEVCALLGFYAAYSGNSLPTCQHNISVPSSGVKKSVIYRRLKMGSIVRTETAVRDYHYTLRNNPGDPQI
jgi:hypothetical protein